MPSESTTPQAPGRGRVLLADDNAVLNAAAARVLRARGFEVQTASDGRLAEALLAQGGFEAVISDVSMPNLDGLQLLGQVRRLDRDLPVVLITGGPSTRAAQAAMAQGAMRYLLKPVAPEALVEVAGQAVEAYRLARRRRAAEPTAASPPSPPG